MTLRLTQEFELVLLSKGGTNDCAKAHEARSKRVKSDMAKTEDTEKTTERNPRSVC